MHRIYQPPQNSSVLLVNRFLLVATLVTVAASLAHSFEQSSLNLKRDFWAGYFGADHVTKLGPESLLQVYSEDSKNFVMFYANWLKKSKDAGEQFARAALEVAYTEGFSDVSFGALDCVASEWNKGICTKENITKYPTFVYFKNGTYHRTYPQWCPFKSDYFYSWIVNEGVNAKYCSGGGVVYHVASSMSHRNFFHSHHFFMFTLVSFTLLSLTRSFM